MSATARPADRPSVNVIGDIAADYYLLLPPPRPGDEKRTATHSWRLPGGTGANAALTAASLGSQVRLYSVVGKDHLGDWLRDSMAAQGVVISAVRVIPGPSTQATILLEADHRQVIVDRGVADRLDDMDPGQLAAASITYVTGSSAVITKIARAGISGQLVAGVEAGMTDDPDLADALRDVDLLLTNSAGWASISGRVAGCATAIETRGREGAVIHTLFHPDEHIPGIHAHAVDTTGAGDCFAGALCHYLAHGAGLTIACRLAVAAAGLSTQALGVQTALLTDAEVRAAAGLPTSAARPGESG